MEWDWDNLAQFSTKAASHMSKQLHAPNHDIEQGNRSIFSSGGIGFSGSDLEHGSSSKSTISASGDFMLIEGMKAYKSHDVSKDFSQKELTQADNTVNFLSMEASASFGEPMSGLKLGKQMYSEDVSQASTVKNSSLSVSLMSSTATTKRPRAKYQSTLAPHCQVEGCNLDLKLAKDYHRRHRICESHSKSPKVIIAGMERRFCQQCSRFHELSDFDDKKRSCRRRLSNHNARRRRPQPEAIHFSPARLSTSLYDGRHQMNVTFSRAPVQAPNRMWESACHFKVDQAGHCLIRPVKAGGVYRETNLPTNEIVDATSMLQVGMEKASYYEGNVPQVFSQASEASLFASNVDIAPDLGHALSLLSTNACGSNKAEPTSPDHLMHANQTSAAQLTHGAASSEDDRSIHFQEFQFSAPYDPGCFYPGQIN